MYEYPVIIIGSGIGGLSAAAYLSKNEIPFLLIEKTEKIGGRCSTRIIEGNPYEIGAIYIGASVFERLRNTFGINFNSYPVRCAARLDEHFVSSPFSWKTVSELNRCGVPWFELLRFRFKTRTLSDPSTFEKYKSVAQVIEELTCDKILQKYLNIMFGVSGISPNRLPANYLSITGQIAKYRAGNPEYIDGGNGRISEILFDYSKKNGKFIFNAAAKKILVKNGVAIGVRTNQGDLKSQIIISNAGLRNTVFNLTDFENWPLSYYHQINEMKPTLKVVNIFLTFSKSIKLPLRTTVFFVADDIESEFNMLERSEFPEQSMFIFHVPTNNGIDQSKTHRATLQFYYPRGKISSKKLRLQVEKTLKSGLAKISPELPKSITNSIVYDPDRYKKKFGFSPYVFGVSPDYSYNRIPIKSPIKNLYCVGDSVMPEGPSVPQAMESGILCARKIIDKLKHDL